MHAGSREKHRPPSELDGYFVRVPLDVHQALARQGLRGSEYQLVMAIMQRFYAPANLDATKKAKQAVGVSYRDLRAATGLGNGQISDGIKSLDGQRVVEVIRRGYRAALFAIRPVEVWGARRKRILRGARIHRRRQLPLKLHRGGGAL